jgi:hypothetical protein
MHSTRLSLAWFDATRNDKPESEANRSIPEPAQGDMSRTHTLACRWVELYDSIADESATAPDTIPALFFCTFIVVRGTIRRLMSDILATALASFKFYSLSGWACCIPN